LEVNLTHANLEVISTPNGAEALVKAYTERPDLILLDDELPDLEVAAVCRRLRDSPQTSRIPVIVISTDNVKGTYGAADKYINYVVKPFDPKQVVSVVKTCLKQIERAENINPLTSLPNQTQLISELTGLIAQDKAFAAIYVDLDNLKIFNKEYCFAQGDRAIQLVAEILCEAVRLFGNPDDLVAHHGGDNFVVVTTIPRARVICRKIIADFDSQIGTLYKSEDLERGYIDYEGRLGQREQCPIMNLRAAVVSTARRMFRHHLEVSEVAAEQIDYLRRFPGSNCYFDRHEVDIEAKQSLTSSGIPYADPEGLTALQKELAWVAFLARELDIPITLIKDGLERAESLSGEFTAEQWNIMNTIRENISQVSRVAEELTHLTSGKWVTDNLLLEEADLRNTFAWIMQRVSEVIEERQIELNIKWVGDIGRLCVEARTLAQALFYALRSVIKFSTPGHQVYIEVSEKTKGFVTIEFVNRGLQISRRELAVLLQGQLEGVVGVGQQSDLWLAKVMLQHLGGRLSVQSKKGEGTFFTILVPKKWCSSREEVNSLLSAAETSRNEAQAQLHELSRLFSPDVKQMPPMVKQSLESLGYKVQELLLLCNRSLFLADEFSERLETQQDELLQQEVAQLATVEAILVGSREIARAMRVDYLFDLDSARRVARYTLTIANEFRLSRIERQALHFAALLKDLGLVSFPNDMLEQKITPNFEKAVALGVRFKPAWKALQRINFLAPALALVLQSYEKRNRGGHVLKSKGANIPLGARILALAEAFESMTSGMSPQGALAPSVAVENLAADSGQRFDPDVVGAFVRAWERKEISVVSSESHWDIE
jgi:response regulator RpfG family c-di-GMP phosphodiesterase